MTEEVKIIKHEMKEQKYEIPAPKLMVYDENGFAIHDDNLTKDKNPKKKVQQ